MRQAIWLFGLIEYGHVYVQAIDSVGSYVEQAQYDGLMVLMPDNGTTFVKQAMIKKLSKKA